jgi:hypothetical protein
MIGGELNYENVPSSISSQPSDVLACLRFARGIGSMGTIEGLRYTVYVVLLDEYVGTLPQMRLRNPKRDPSKPFVYIGLTPLRVDRQFDFRRATAKTEWRVHQYGVRLMPELFEHLNFMKSEKALQTARKLAEDLRANGFGVANGVCTGSQLYQSILAKANSGE